MTARPPTPAEDTAMRALLGPAGADHPADPAPVLDRIAREQALRERLRARLTHDDLEVLGRAAVARVETCRQEGGAPGWTPGTPSPTADKEPQAMATVHKHPLDLDVGDVIAIHPDTGKAVEYRVAAPPVRFEDMVEVDYACAGASGRLVVAQRDRVTVDTTHRERRLHAMGSSEEHYALRWLADHEPAAFDRAADYVDQIRRLDDGVRKESRS